MLTPITSKEFSMLSMGNASRIRLCNTGSLRLPGARQQNQKFVPAKSADIVALAQLLPDISAATLESTLSPKSWPY